LDESADGRAGLELAVRAVVNLDARAVGDLLERERNRAERRGKLLIRQAGDEHAVFEEREVGDGLLARVALALALALHAVHRRVGQLGAGMLHLVERDDFKVAVTLHAHNDGRRAGTPAARDGEVGGVRGGIDGEVVNEHLVGGGAEQRGDLLVDAVHLHGLGRAALGVTRGDGHDGGGLGIGDEQDALGAEGERPGGFERDLAFGHAGGPVGGGGGPGQQSQTE
jgi:hypothetical protein